MGQATSAPVAGTAAGSKGRHDSETGGVGVVADAYPAGHGVPVRAIGPEVPGAGCQPYGSEWPCLDPQRRPFY